MDLKTELEKDLLKKHWWFDLNNHGMVHISHLGFHINIRECDLYRIAESHGMKKNDVTILVGG